MTDETDRLETLIDWETRVKNARKLERKAKAIMDLAKETAKNATADWTKAVEQTGRAIDAADEERPMYPAMEVADNSKDNWRSTMIGNIEGFSPTIIKHLNAAGLKTLGKLANHCEKYALTDIKGIGDGMAHAINNALADYWAKHPQE